MRLAQLHAPAEELADNYPNLAALGFDPVDQPMSWTVFGQRLVREDRTLRQLLMDPKFVVGLGPVYSDEILHAALLRHDRKANELITQEIRRLYRAIVETVHNAVKHRGTSLDGSADVFGDAYRRRSGGVVTCARSPARFFDGSARCLAVNVALQCLHAGPGGEGFVVGRIVTAVDLSKRLIDGIRRLWGAGIALRASFALV